MTKIAIQGQKASFHDIATREFFDNDVEIVDCETFTKTFEVLKNAESDYAVVAVENSLYGPINPVYDLLLKYKPWVCGEIYLRIEHCLIGLPGAELKNITEVHSQVMAIGQCEGWLERNLPQAKHIEQHDTTASVVMIKAMNDPTKAAIASKLSADLHDMKVLVRNVEDHHENYTRFFVLRKSKTNDTNANKTSLVLQTPEDTKAGSLFHALEIFTKHNINLTALHSRPIIGKAWHYMFYIDIEIDSNSKDYSKVFDALEKQGCHIEVLGNYINGLA